MYTKQSPRKSSKLYYVLILVCVLALNLGSIGGMSVQAASSFSVIATIPVGVNPSGIAVNENNNRIYVTNYTDGTVSVIDGNTNTVIATVPVSGGPSGIGVNPSTNKIYVANHSDGNPVTVLDGNTNTVITNIPVNINAFGVGVNPNTNRIYVSVQPNVTNGPYIDVIDGSTDSVIATIPCGGILDPVRGVEAGYCSPSHVVIDPSTNKAYVHDYNAGVVVIDNTDTVVSAITGVGGGSNDFALGVNPNSRRLYVGSSISLNVPLSVINLDTQETVTTVPLPNNSLPIGIGVNASINHIYIALFSGTFLVLDGATNTFIGEPLSISSYLGGVAVNQLTNRVYVTNQIDNTVTVIEDSSSPPTPTPTPTIVPTITPTAVPEQDIIDYFALGDSIASGHGLIDDKSACRRSNRSYPYIVADFLRTRHETVNFPTSIDEDGTEVQHFLACSGATALPPAPGFTGDPNKVFPYQVGYVLAHLSDRPTLVSITIGANDFGWTNLPNLFARLYVDSDKKYQMWVDHKIEQIKKPVKAMVELLLEEDNVAIVITDFHNPFNSESIIFRGGPGNKCALRDCYARTQYITQKMTDMIIDIRTELGNPERLQIVSVVPPFQGHESPSPICGAAEPDFNNTYIQFPYDIYSNSDPELPGWLTKQLGEVHGGDCFHPNDTGAAIYAQYVNDDALRLGR